MEIENLKGNNGMEVDFPLFKAINRIRNWEDKVESFLCFSIGNLIFLIMLIGKKDIISISSRLILGHILCMFLYNTLTERLKINTKAKRGDEIEGHRETKEKEYLIECSEEDFLYLVDVIQSIAQFLLEMMMLKNVKRSIMLFVGLLLIAYVPYCFPAIGDHLSLMLLYSAFLYFILWEKKSEIRSFVMNRRKKRKESIQTSKGVKKKKKRKYIKQKLFFFFFSLL